MQFILLICSNGIIFWYIYSGLGNIISLLLEIKSKMEDFQRLINFNIADSTSITIGKSDQSNIIIEDSNWEDKHIIIQCCGENCYLRCFKSQYLTLFQLPVGKEIILSQSDFIIIANCVRIFYCNY